MPNPLMAEIHDRMPVILPSVAREYWLDPEFEGKETLLSLLKPYPEQEMPATRVSTVVNCPKNDDPCCLNPI